MASDAELIGWSVAGDNEAFVELMHRHEKGVWTYVARRVGRGPAEDQVSEVWVAAFTSRSTYDRAFPDARPWLFGIARNVVRGYWRCRPDEVLEPEMGGLAPSSDPWPAVDAQIHGAAVLRRALSLLRPEHREILLLVVWEELSVAEAARIVNIPAGTARYHLHQARMALRDAPGVVALLTELNVVMEAKCVMDAK